LKATPFAASRLRKSFCCAMAVGFHVEGLPRRLGAKLGDDDGVGGEFDDEGSDCGARPLPDEQERRGGRRDDDDE
jgi:hypothetical protein